MDTDTDTSANAYINGLPPAEKNFIQQIRWLVGSTYFVRLKTAARLMCWASQSTYNAKSLGKFPIKLVSMPLPGGGTGPAVTIFDLAEYISKIAASPLAEKKGHPPGRPRKAEIAASPLAEKTGRRHGRPSKAEIAAKAESH